MTVTMAGAVKKRTAPQVSFAISILGKVAEKKSGKSVVFCQTPLGPPPPLPGLVFLVKKIDPHFFCWKMHLQCSKRILRLVPFKNKKKYFLILALFFRGFCSLGLILKRS